MNKRKLMLLKNTCDSLSDEGIESDINNYKFLIDPKSRWKKYWDMTMSCMIIYSVFIDPIRLTFPELDYEFYTYIDVLFDFFFITDIIFNFFIPYYEKGLLIKNKTKIILNYLARWFVFDFISSLPFSLVVMIMSNFGNKSSLLGLKNLLKISRIYRMIKWTSIFRLIKFAKLRSSKSKFDPDLEEDTAMIRILKFVFLFIILLHICSCLWIYIGTPTEYQQQTWIYNNYLEDAQPHEVYTASLYFNLVTIYTIGYGDIRPYTFWERFYNCFFMSIALILFSFSITSLSTIFERYNSLKIKLKEKLAYAKDLFLRYKMSRDLYKKLKISIRHNSGKVILEKFDLLDSLPEALKKEVFMQMIRTGISNYKFFLNQDKEFIFYVLPMLKSLVIEKNEAIISYGDFIEEMYIVDSGILSVCLEKIYDNIQISQVKRNQHFGDILMYLNENCPYIISSFTSRSELMSINKSDFSKIKLAYNSCMLQILKNSCDYFYNLEKSKRVVKILYDNNIPISEIKFKLKKLNNILMERNFDDMFLQEIHSQEAEDFIINNPAEKIVEFLKTPMREKDFIRIFAKDVEDLLDDDENNNRIQLHKNTSMNGLLNSQKNSILQMNVTHNQNESVNSSDNDNDIAIKKDLQERKRRYTMQIFDNINLGNVASKLGSSLHRNNTNINANISIYNNIRKSFDGSEFHNKLFDQIKEENTKQFQLEYEKSKINREIEQEERLSIFRNSQIINLNENKKSCDLGNKNRFTNISHSNIGLGKDLFVIQENPGDLVDNVLEKEQIKKRRSHISGYDTIIKKKINEGLQEPAEIKIKQTSSILSRKKTQHSKFSNRSNRHSKRNFKGKKKDEKNKTIITNNDKNCDDGKKKEIIKKYNKIEQSQKKKYNYNKESESSKTNDYDTKFMNSSSRQLKHEDSDESIKLKSENDNNKNRNNNNTENKYKKEKKNLQNKINQNKNSIYKIFKFYNYGDNINNNYIINANTHTSRSEENQSNSKLFLDLEKKFKHDTAANLNSGKFNSNKLICFKTHCMEYHNNTLEIEQIDKIIYSENFHQTDSRVNLYIDNFQKENNQLLRINSNTPNANLIADSFRTNGTIDMPKLNVFIDENFLSYSKSNTRDQCYKEDKKESKEMSFKKDYVNSTYNLANINSKNKDAIKNNVGLNNRKEYLNSPEILKLASFKLKKNLPYISSTHFLKSKNNNKSDHHSRNLIENESPLIIDKKQNNTQDNEVIIQQNISIIKYGEPPELELIRSFRDTKTEIKNIKKFDIKLEENKNNEIKKSIKQDRAMLKLDYIYSIVKVIDKYKEQHKNTSL